MLSEREEGQVAEIAELTVRRYFDNYLNEVFPKQIAAVVEAHNAAADAHGGIRETFSKHKWLVMGFIAGGGIATGAGIERLFSILGG